MKQCENTKVINNFEYFFKFLVVVKIKFFTFAKLKKSSRLSDLR